MGLGWSSVVVHLPCICESLDLNPALHNEWFSFISVSLNVLFIYAEHIQHILNLVILDFCFGSFETESNISQASLKLSM